MIYKKYIKRCIDIISSLILIIGLLWVFIIIAVTIKLSSKGPILYKQKRIGKDKKEFQILKFRTMKTTAPGDIPTHLLINSDKYITRFGNILRKTSLDELPQLFNILIGDMSLIGPRPALWNQYDLIAERDVYGVNSIRPGLTGWAQVNGRDEITYILKAKYDNEYLIRMSLKFDMICILKTIKCVAMRDGIKEGAVERTDSYEESFNNWS